MVKAKVVGLVCNCSDLTFNQPLPRLVGHCFQLRVFDIAYA